VAKIGTSNSDRTISLRLQCVVKKHKHGYNFTISHAQRIAVYQHRFTSVSGSGGRRFQAPCLVSGYSLSEGSVCSAKQAMSAHTNVKHSR